MKITFDTSDYDEVLEVLDYLKTLVPEVFIDKDLTDEDPDDEEEEELPLECDGTSHEMEDDFDDDLEEEICDCEECTIDHPICRKYIK